MTNKEILEKAIEKALINGWSMFNFAGKLVNYNVDEQDFSYQVWLMGRIDERMVWPLRATLNDILFNHDFAKAFWGEEEMDGENLETAQDKFNYWTSSREDGGVYYEGKVWEYHLQQMVIEPDPIKYLKKFL